jgi:hypothetical protein
LSPIAVIPYRPEYAADFRRLNLEWIERLFKVEGPDLKALDDPGRASTDFAASSSKAATCTWK